LKGLKRRLVAVFLILLLVPLIVLAQSDAPYETEGRTLSTEVTEEDIEEAQDEIGSSLNWAMESSYILGRLFGNERMNVVVAGLESPFHITTGDGTVEDIGGGVLEDPTMIIFTDIETIDQLRDGEITILEALEEDRIEYQGVGFMNSMIFRIMDMMFGATSFFSGLLGEEEEFPEEELPGVETPPQKEEVIPINESEDTCEIKCCCRVSINHWVYCSEWKEGSRGFNDIGDYPYNRPQGASTTWSSHVSGAYQVWSSQTMQGEGGCSTMEIFWKTFQAKGDDCKPENKKKFCKENYQSECSGKKDDVKKASDEAREQCVEDAKAKCKSGFREAYLTPLAEATDYC